MRVDVAIIGASLSGCAAASLLGRAGLRTALIDRTVFPRRKPCGEGMASAGVQLLKQVAAPDILDTVPHLEYSGYLVHCGAVERWLNPLLSSGITVQRGALDSALLHSVLRDGTVDGYFGSAVREIGDVRTVHVGSDRISARHLIFAHGSNCNLAERFGAVKKLRPGTRIGVSTTFSGKYAAAPRAVHIFIESECELYCTPLAGGRLNISALSAVGRELPLNDLRFGGRLRRKLFDHLSFEGELELEPMGRAAIGGARKLMPIPGVWCVGDVAEELDPLGGMGMTHALQSGILAAEWILRAESGEVALAAASSGYIEQRRCAVRPLRRFTKLCSGVLHASLHLPPLLSVAASPVGRAVTRAVMFA